MKQSDFDIALDFYKTHVNKAFVLNYDQKLTLAALFNQAKHGPFSPEKAPDVGMFDFVGRERRSKWQSLGAMTKSEAQDTFVQTLLQICPQFAAHLEANDTIPIQNGDEIDPLDANDLPPMTVHSTKSYSQSVAHPRIHLSPAQESQIRTALNTQTLDQFRAYAAQYYPDNETMQAELIAQLQERHFHQYMVYIAENPPAHLAGSSIDALTDAASSPARQANGGDESSVEKLNEDGPKTITPTLTQSAEDECDAVATIPDGRDRIAAPQMWTRKDIAEFKSLLSKDPDSIINVGSGELVTIRVPVVESGNCIVWEFATDNYDIGFGLSFEWSPESKDAATETEQTMANGSESSKVPWNLIQGSSQPPESTVLEFVEAVTEELIPIYKRTSHTEIYCGSHVYPAKRGTYLLKFDNTYSLWRSKMLYYRVYCAQ